MENVNWIVYESASQILYIELATNLLLLELSNSLIRSCEERGCLAVEELHVPIRQSLGHCALDGVYGRRCLAKCAID